MIYFFREAKNTGNWSLLHKKEYENLLDFLIPQEHSCTAFTSRLKDPSKIFFSRQSLPDVFVEKSDGKIISALLDSPDGIIFPVLSAESSVKEIEEIIRISRAGAKRFVTLMGKSIDVETVSAFFKSRKEVSLDYNQLIALSSDIPANVDEYLSKKQSGYENSIKIKLAGIKNLDELMPLRKAYEIEEVLLNSSEYIEASSRLRFSRSIMNKAVLFGAEGGTPVATCCINAEGFKWNQVGGVYTVPEHRSKGIAAMMMKQLARTSMKQNKDLTLFVKKNNIPALKLYKNCGFKESGEYRISYLERR